MRRSNRSAFTVLELLVTMAVLGVLLALLLPAVAAARESTRRVQCVSHLREIGIALHHHHDAQKSLPAGWTFDSENQSAYGWVVPLLPFLEQRVLADLIDRKRTIDDPQHQLARETTLECMLCPSDIAEPTFMLFEDESFENNDGENTLGLSTRTLALAGSSQPRALVELPTANYVGVFGTIEPDDEIPAPIGDGPFLENRVTRFREFQRGLTHTFLVGERTMAQVPSTWLGVHLSGEDAAARLVGSALEGINNPLADECDFSSRHGSGANFLWGDGHVSFVTTSVDLRTYHTWSQLRLEAQH